MPSDEDEKKSFENRIDVSPGRTYKSTHDFDELLAHAKATA